MYTCIYMICIYIWYVYIYDMCIYIWYVYIYLRIIFVFVTPTETNSRIGQGGDGGMALVPGRRGDWFWRKSVRMRDGTSIVKGSIGWYKFVWFVLFTSSMYEYSMHTLGKTMQRLGCFGVRTSSGPVVYVSRFHRVVSTFRVVFATTYARAAPALKAP
jgi:hypothetical protein